MESLGKFPDVFLGEIAGQPAALLRAAAAIDGQVGQLARLSDTRGPSPVLTGMGASYFAGYPAASALGGSGILAAMVDAAELLHFRREAVARATPLVAVSQSGRSAE